MRPSDLSRKVRKPRREATDSGEAFVTRVSHLREATVVGDDGKPLGIFRDVDGKTPESQPKKIAIQSQAKKS